MEKFTTTTGIYSTTTQPIKQNDETLLVMLVVFFGLVITVFPVLYIYMRKRQHLEYFELNEMS